MFCVSRAPELVLYFDGVYDYSIDIWSAGCVFGELLSAMRGCTSSAVLPLFLVTNSFADATGKNPVLE